MSRVTILAADGPLGRSIIDEAKARQLQLTAIASDPSRLIGLDSPIEVVRGELLDLTYPERLFENAEVVVFPLGSWDSESVDMDADRHAAFALCQASERIAQQSTRLVVAGRVAIDPKRTQQLQSDTFGERIGSSLVAGDLLLGELVTLSVFSAYLQSPWNYTSPYFSPSGARPHEFITMLQTHRPMDCSQMTRANYLCSILDSVEGNRAVMPFTAGNSPLSSPSSDDASAMVMRPNR